MFLQVSHVCGQNDEQSIGLRCVGIVNGCVFAGLQLEEGGLYTSREWRQSSWVAGEMQTYRVRSGSYAVIECQDQKQVQVVADAGRCAYIEGCDVSAVCMYEHLWFCVVHVAYLALYL